MDNKDGFATIYIRLVNDNVAVEATGTQQCRFEYIGAVSSRQNNNVGAAVEAVHLYKYLIQSLFSFIVASAQTGAAMSAHSIYLVNEDDAWGIALGLGETV